METEELDKLHKLASKTKYTATDKRFIESASEQAGLHFERTACTDCYRDQVLVILHAIKDAENAQNTDRKYVLRDGVDVTFRGMRINEVTLTDEIAERILAQGFPSRLFAKC